MNKYSLDLLLMHIVRLPSLREQALIRMRKENWFDEMMNPIHYYIWSIILEVEKHRPGIPLPVIFIKGELDLKIASTDDFRDYQTEADELINLMMTTPEDQLSPEHGEELLNSFVIEHTRKVFMERSDALFDQEDIDRFINEMPTIISQPKTTETLIHPLENLEQYLEEAPLVKTEMEPLDYISGGGMPRKTVNGLLGPTGGGKTMLTYQIAVGQAKHQQHILIGTYEQGVKGDIAHRLASGIIEVDIDELRKPMARWKPEYREQYLSWKPALSPYVHIDDLTLKGAGCQGIHDIQNAFDKLCARNQRPIYIIVDWLKPAIMRYLVHNNMKTDDETWRSQAYIFLDQCGQFVKDTDTIMIVNHQLDTKMARASSRKKPVVTDAMELKSFANTIDACYLLGNRNKDNNVAWLLSDKNRRGAPLDMLVVMNGALARFEEAEGWVANHQGKFIKENEVNAMPTISDSEKGPGLAGNYV